MASLERGMPKESFEAVELRFALNTIELGYCLQRLFSTFPNSWPGFGLFLLRLCLAAALQYVSIRSLTSPTERVMLVQELVAVAGSIFLLGGLWTPVVAAVVAIDEAWIAFTFYSPGRDEAWVRMFLAILAASVAMLGPGAWSIDARLFGRQRFDLDRARGKNPSL